MTDAERIIKLYDMKPLKGEGGYFVETYRAGEKIDESFLPGRYGGDKSLSTAILYLLTPDTKSFFHRLRSDEVYHFYLGDPVRLVLIHPNGSTKVLFLGHDLRAGQFVQAVVPAGMWQGLSLLDGGEYALMGTTVAPGFDPPDVELGEREDMLARFPRHGNFIMELTPDAKA